MAANKITVEVAYALPEKQVLITLEIAVGSTVLDAILQAKILQQFPEIDLQKNKVGIFSKACALSDLVHNHDRIEIYRPLIIDPKERRRAKAQLKKSKK